MPFVWAIQGAILLLGIGGAAGVYKAGDNTTAGIKENILPLATIGAATFLALRMLQKAGKA